MMFTIPKMKRNNACSNSIEEKMPIIGMGTAVYPFVEEEVAIMAILNGIKVGYRHFDTSSSYYTEQYLGAAISEALRLGLIESRDELFITSKLWCCDAHPNLVLPALQNSLRNLRLEYLDLYLIHWPVSSKPEPGPGVYKFPIPAEDLLPIDLESVWAAMEDCQKLGLTKSIGVSNFSCKKLENLLNIATIPPAVSQVEINPLWQQKKLREFCKDKGILITGYSPLGGKGTIWGTDRVMECEVLHEIAKARGKSHAQICLRWVYEQGVSLLVKSFNEERMKENLEIFDWELNEEDLKKIGEIPQCRSLVCDPFLSPNGPFKTEEEFWDGEVCLRWVYEQGASILVRSFNEERMKENLEIFDWELSEEDLKKISEIPQSRSEFYNYAEFVSPDGPFKTLEELWDEI